MLTYFKVIVLFLKFQFQFEFSFEQISKKACRNIASKVLWWKSVEKLFSEFDFYSILLNYSFKLLMNYDVNEIIIDDQLFKTLFSEEQFTFQKQ